MKVLRNVARKVGATNLAGEKGVAVIPLGGFDNWQHVGAFAWLNDNLLDKSVATYVILDRDNRPDQQVFDVVNELSANGIHGHVWGRKELESYFLLPGVISRISGASVEVVQELLTEAILEQKVDAQAQFIHRRQLTMVSATMDAMTVYRNVLPNFEQIWQIQSSASKSAHPRKLWQA